MYPDEWELSRRQFVGIGAGAAATVALGSTLARFDRRVSPGILILGSRETAAEHAGACHVACLPWIGWRDVTPAMLLDTTAREHVTRLIATPDVGVVVIASAIATRGEVLELVRDAGKLAVLRLPLPDLSAASRAISTQACMPRRASGSDDATIAHLRSVVGAATRVDVGVMVTRPRAEEGVLVRPTDVWSGITEELDFCRRLLDVRYPSSVSANSWPGAAPDARSITWSTRVQLVYPSSEAGRSPVVNLTITEVVSAAGTSESPADITSEPTARRRKPRSLTQRPAMTRTALRVVGAKTTISTHGYGLGGPAMGHAPSSLAGVYRDLASAARGGLDKGLRADLADALPSYAVLHVASAALAAGRSLRLDPVSGAVLNDSDVQSAIWGSHPTPIGERT